MDLILSDIHSNIQALRAVMRYARRRAIKRYVLLGDLVGYGANPNETLELIREMEPLVAVRGNHDRSCLTPGIDMGFSLPARTAVTWTKGQLTEEHAWFLENLPMGPRDVGEDYQIAHGSPLNEDAYLLHPREALQAFDGFRRQLCFFGHTHLAEGYELDEGAQRLTRLTFEPGAWFQLRDGCRYLVNPGSVGQPRDRDPRVSFMTYDPTARRLKLHRLDYDFAGAARAILAAGLHPNLAERLQHGM
jgi:predicted phosphodiesterase